ncbi:hypothetical protein [Nocardia brasiliensis]
MLVDAVGVVVDGACGVVVDGAGELDGFGVVLDGGRGTVVCGTVLCVVLCCAGSGAVVDGGALAATPGKVTTTAVAAASMVMPKAIRWFVRRFRACGRTREFMNPSCSPVAGTNSGTPRS